MPMNYTQSERVRLEAQGFRLLTSLPDEEVDIRRRLKFYQRDGRVVLIEKEGERITRYIKLTKKGKAWAKRTGRTKLLEAFRTDIRRKTERTRLDIEEAGWVASAADDYDRWDNGGIYKFKEFLRNTNLRTYRAFTNRGRQLARKALESKNRYLKNEFIGKKIEELQTFLDEFVTEWIQRMKDDRRELRETMLRLTPEHSWQIPFQDYKAGKFKIIPVKNKKLKDILLRHRIGSRG
jgi:hypothetical protein